MPLPSPVTKPSFEPLLQRLSTAVISLDAQCRVVTLNAAAESLFSVSVAQTQGRYLGVAILPLRALMERVWQTLDAGMACAEREFELAGPGAQPLWIDICMTPLDPPSGRHAMLMECFAFGRQHRLTRDAQARSQERANREVMRGLAHEVKNPLGGLRGAAQLLGRELSDPDLAAYTRVIMGEADRLLNLVDRLLGPKAPPAKEAVNIHRVLEHVYQLVSADLPAGVRLERDYDPSIPNVSADEGQLVQALLNVVQNAVEAVSGNSTDSGRVLLRSRAQRQHTIAGTRYRLVARIDVVDNGPGFDEALRERMFLPLVTNRADGGGLGLSIAQHLVHRHGGAIDCISRPGETIFSIYLPLGEPA